MPRRPVGLTIAYIPLFMWGCLAITATILVFPVRYFLFTWPEWMLPHGRMGLYIEVLYSLYNLVVGILSVSVGYGMWKRKSWLKRWISITIMGIIGQMLIFILYIRLI
jgi:hypothetical protein